ncbi:hypothetical protein FHG87_016757, partial [Trinorchestia longiramus]
TVLLVVIVVPHTRAQLGLSPGTCPIYQTSDWFTNKKISEIVANEGYLIALSLASEHSDHKCARLHFFDGTSFTYSYVDATGREQERTGSFKALPSGFTTAGRIELSGLLPTTLGSDVFGNTYLYPIYEDESGLEVYVTCTSYGILHSERVYGLVPYKNAVLRSDLSSIKRQLTLKSIPQASTLRIVNQQCQDIQILSEDSVASTDEVASTDNVSSTDNVASTDNVSSTDNVASTDDVSS